MGGGTGQPHAPFLAYLLLQEDRADQDKRRPRSPSEKRALRRSTTWGVDWLLWRVVTSPRIPDGLKTVQRYTLPDLLEGHLVLDTLQTVEEAAENHARRQARANRERGRRGK